MLQISCETDIKNHESRISNRYDRFTEEQYFSKFPIAGIFMSSTGTVQFQKPIHVSLLFAHIQNYHTCEAK